MASSQRRQTCSGARSRDPSPVPTVSSQPDARCRGWNKSEAVMADTLAQLRDLPEFNGRAVVMGFCYGGPYAILGPKRLGYAAGVSCHGTRLQDYIGELEGVTAPICIIADNSCTAY